MAPKRAAKAKAKAKVKAKAKARVRRAAGRGLPGGRPPRRRGVRRRPAAEHPAPPGEARVEDGPKTLWGAGHSVRMQDAQVEWLMSASGIVLEDAKYYHKECKVAGHVQGASYRGGEVYLTLKPTGTTEDHILHMQSTRKDLVLRVHKCGPSCDHEEVADDLIHGQRVRALRIDGADEGWTGNLAKIGPVEDEDELERMRAEMLARPKKDESGIKALAKEKDEKEPEKKGKKKKKKDKKKKDDCSSDQSEEEIPIDGSKCRLASQKRARDLYEGTGMDPKEKVRAKVSKLARKFARKKKTATSSSGTDSKSEEDDPGEAGQESIFQQATKVRAIAEHYPGALAAAAIAQMRSNLLLEIGVEDRRGKVPAVALQYMRQSLAKRRVGRSFERS